MEVTVGASIDDIKTGLLALAAQVKWKNGQMHEKAFGTLIADLATWFEKNGKLGIEANDHKNIARVILHDQAVNKKFSAVQGKIGPFATNQLPALVVAVVAGPSYTALDTQYNGNSTQDVRNDVVRVLGITDKGHIQHGSNFSGPQTLRQIIKNVLAKVTKGTPEWTRVEGLLQKHYPGYL